MAKNMCYKLLLVAGIAAVGAYPTIADAGTPELAQAQGHQAHGGSGTDGAPANPAEAKRIVRVDALDTTFNVKQIQVRPGETIKFIITNKSSIVHEFVIASHAEHLEHRKMMQQMSDMTMNDEPNGVTVQPNQTNELVWKFGKDKDVEFACDIPGHAEQGMVGTFQVMK